MFKHLRFYVQNLSCYLNGISVLNPQAQALLSVSDNQRNYDIVKEGGVVLNQDASPTDSSNYVVVQNQDTAPPADTDTNHPGYVVLQQDENQDQFGNYQIIVQEDGVVTDTPGDYVVVQEEPAASSSGEQENIQTEVITTEDPTFANASVIQVSSVLHPDTLILLH